MRAGGCAGGGISSLERVAGSCNEGIAMTLPVDCLAKSTGGNSCDGDGVGDEAVDSGSESIETLVAVSRGSLLAHLVVLVASCRPSSLFLGVAVPDAHCITWTLLPGVLLLPVKQYAGTGTNGTGATIGIGRAIPDDGTRLGCGRDGVARALVPSQVRV